MTSYLLPIYESLAFLGEGLFGTQLELSWVMYSEPIPGVKNCTNPKPQLRWFKDALQSHCYALCTANNKISQFPGSFVPVHKEKTGARGLYLRDNELRKATVVQIWSAWQCLVFRRFNETEKHCYPSLSRPVLSCGRYDLKRPLEFLF